MSRVADLLPRAKGSPEYNMKLLIPRLGNGGIIPQPDKYYVFVYKAKTRGIQYDQHPFIVCTGVYNWGFVGVNFHWGSYRRYSWREVLSNIYEVYEDEIEDMQKYKIARFKVA